MSPENSDNPPLQPSPVSEPIGINSQESQPTQPQDENPKPVISPTLQSDSGSPKKKVIIFFFLVILVLVILSAGAVSYFKLRSTSLKSGQFFQGNLQQQTGNHIQFQI